MSQFLSFVRDHPHTQIFAHFGGIFDFLFLLEAVFKSPDVKLKSIIPRGSGILCLSVVFDNGKEVTFRDSSALLPFGLKKITETFGVESKKLAWDHSKTTTVTPELLDYLETDCRGLFQSLKKYFDSELIQKAGPKYTIASQAIQVLRTYLKEPVPACPDFADAFVRSAYAGGRTEIFRPLYENESRLLRCYDVNSLYPFIMQNNEFPTHCMGFSRQLDLERMGFIECEVTVPENNYLPILWRKDGKFIFPVGTFKGVWSTAELRLACDRGAEIRSTGRCLYFENGGSIFRDYVADLYAVRKQSRSEVERTIVKLLLNSTYGRMGLNLTREGLEIDIAQEGVIPHFELNVGGETIRFAKTQVTLRSFSNVAIAAWVTALARIHLFRLMEPIQHEIYYSDTDSVFTPADLPTSGEIGDLKLEYEMERACFLLPKTYVAGEKIAMKGFDKKKIQKFTFDDFRSALEGEMRLQITTDAKMSRFKTALKHKTLLHLAKPGTKRIRSLYDKRVLYRDNSGKWDTKPIHLA